MTFVEDQEAAWNEIPKLTRLSPEPLETVNGPGATMDATVKLREQLPSILRQFKVRTILDVGCGDWTWMRHVDLSQLDTYIGWDIDKDSITENKRVHGDDGRLHFDTRNLLDDDCVPPKVDLILARHVLIHMPNGYIAQALEKIKACGAKYLMTSHWPDADNDETQPDGFRYRGYMERRVNLTAAPFGWPQPVEWLREPAIPGGAILSADHQLAVFEIPARSFKSRTHHDDEFSVFGSISKFKERIDAIYGDPDDPGSEQITVQKAKLQDILLQYAEGLAEAEERAQRGEPQICLGLQIAATKQALLSLLAELIGVQK